MSTPTRGDPDDRSEPEPGATPNPAVPPSAAAEAATARQQSSSESRDAPAPGTPGTPAPGEGEGEESSRTTPDRSAAGRAGSGSRRQSAAEVGRELRQLRRDFENLHRDVGEASARLAEAGAQWRQTTGRITELLPRVATLEARLDALQELLETAPGKKDHDEDGDVAEWVATPPMGWDELDHDQAAAAWEALARWVGDTLHEQYRLTRLQLPDCWPVHPRAVRELAWLRSTYISATEAETEAMATGPAAEWHARWLPAALNNVAAAIDPRECRPGLHRLTEQEVTSHEAELARHERGERSRPVVSDETGPQRPRLRPEHFPTRAVERRRSTGPGPAPPTVATLPLLLVESAEPRFWIDYFDEARRADLDRRVDHDAA